MSKTRKGEWLWNLFISRPSLIHLTNKQNIKVLFSFWYTKNEFTVNLSIFALNPVIFCIRMMLEKLSLKWKDFHSNAANAFGLFRDDDYLHDVTLVSDDQKQISAHKLVLSACSEYFNYVFKQNKHSHPLLCLEGVSNQDLKNILDYIYKGEVQIYQEDLERFLTVAQRLKLNGLLGNDETEKDIEEIYNEEELFKKEDSNSSIPEMISPSRDTASNEKSFHDNRANREASSISINAEEIDKVNEKVEEYLQKCEDGSYRCTVCGKTISNRNAKQNMRNHIETHFDGLSFSCSFCEKIFRSRHSLTCHKSVFHRS